MCKLIAHRIFYTKMTQNDFSTISDIINSDIFDGLKQKNAFKYTTIFSFWGQITGKKYKDVSKPITIKAQKLYVICKSPYVVQELMMYKNVLLDKLKPYSEPLNVKITDIIFDYKSWQKSSANSNNNDFSYFYTQEELSKVAINESELQGVFSNIDSSNYLTDEQKQKFKERIIKLSKAKKLRTS